MSVAVDPQAAPGALEQVRALLNTWVIPNDLRVPVDQFDDYRRVRRLGARDAELLRALRDDLRAVVERAGNPDDLITLWIERLRIELVIADGALAFRHEVSPAGDALVVVLEAIASETWPRLKACPDCRWVFYDRTRSGTKRWCLMNAAGSTGRGCGNIAKARRHRARQKASHPT